ncbi:RNA methyltransferase [Propionivibrio sp.]|uniref:TrmH family RNA methyltransferase n=1 Tax=Propionivibrio sp. TaxID=2212460 RepID=UPI00261D2654|nr:RNA methyltransferase [Propionivibrio sp.]
MKYIASRENAHFKALKKLCQSGRERRKTQRVLLDGMHLIESYVQHYGAPEEVVVSESGALLAQIARYLENNNGINAISILSDTLFDDLTTVETPSGIMAIVMQPRCAHRLNQEGDAILLDGIQDPGNLGSILRSAAAAGFRQLLLSVDCAQAWSPKTLRAAMGAHFQLDIHENCDLPAFLGGYRGQAILTALDATAELYSLDLKQPMAWIFGNEGQGVREEVAQSAQLRVRIPMPGATESLNVAAAAAICLFETVRQRR